MKKQSWEIRFGRQLLALAIILTAATPAVGDVRTWIGAGDDAQASTAANWQDNNPPGTGESVLFGDAHLGNAHTNVTWDLEIDIQNWTQTEDYTGTITIQTKYPGLGFSFTNLTISGDVTLDGGVWTHPANTGGDNETDRLAVSVGGDFTLGANARVNLDRRGFGGGRGPGAGNGSNREGSRTASHGGLGAMNPEGSSTYGFIAQPESLGSGGRGQGGGALFLRVTGDAVIDGILSADGYNRGYSGDFGSESRLNRYTHGSGGSIFLRAAAVTGSGTVRATLMSQSAYRGSGGGRLALVAANSADFSNLTLNVNPHPSPNTADPVYAGLSGAAGTMYLEDVSSRKLIIDQNDIAMSPEARTEIPASLEVYDPPPGVGGELEDADLVITNGALVVLTRDLRLNDLGWLCEKSTLDLNGFDLYFKAEEPAGFPEELSEGGTNSVAIPAALGGGTVSPNGGRILWDDQPYTARIFAWAGPHGSLDNFDPEEEYIIGSSLTITAVPDQGYSFIRWLGDVPEEQMYDPVWEMTIANRHFRAVFASDAPNTRSWMGTGANPLAGTPENWHPQGVPQDGDHIVLEDTSYAHVTWDLEIADLDERWTDWIYHSVDMDWNLDLESVASWTQSEYYTGKVNFNTQYPGQGNPTNLTILGDGILEGGVWTHFRNPAGDTQVNRLAVGVGGDFRLGTHAVIDLDGQGFRQESGPGAGVHGENEVGRSASHGGAGARNPETSSTYGSIFKPVDLGSGAYSQPSGGGALFLVADGDVTLDGQIWARGVNPGRGVTRRAWERLSPGAGGSIFIQGRGLTGSGVLDAGQNPVTEGAVRPVYYGSGGGRIALIGRESAGFEYLTLQAYSRDDQPREGGGRSGTIYLECPASRGIIIDQNHIGESSDNYTDIPAVLNPGDTMFDDVALALKNGAFVRITMPDMRIRDLTMCTDSTLNLAGHTLYVNNLEPPADTLGTIIKDGGEIVWLKRGSLIILR